MHSFLSALPSSGPPNVDSTQWSSGRHTRRPLDTCTCAASAGVTSRSVPLAAYKQIPPSSADRPDLLDDPEATVRSAAVQKDCEKGEPDCRRQPYPPDHPDILLQPYQCRTQVRVPRIATIRVSAGQLPTTIFRMLLDLSQLASEVFPIIGSAWYASSPRRYGKNPTPSKASCLKACRDTAVVDTVPIE